MKRWWFALLVAVASGCAGLGNASLVPHQSNSDVSRSPAPEFVDVPIVLHIPAAAAMDALRSNYVSPNTKSLTVQVQHVTASPWPSPIPKQLLIVATPSPCTGSRASGFDCRFRMRTATGQNIFTLNTYAAKHPVAKSTPLATLRSGFVRIDAKPKALRFTLEGVVNSVLLDVPSPESSHAPTTQAIPIARPTAFPLMVTPEDASGAAILTDVFSKPFALHLNAKAGITLAISSPCPENPGPTSGNAIDIACASELTDIAVTYDGSVTRSATGVVDSVVVAASPQPSASASNATVAFSSGIQSSTVLATIPLAQYEAGGQSLALGPDHLMYFYAGSDAGATIGEFDPANPASSQQVYLSGAVGTIFVDSNDHIWIEREIPPAKLTDPYVNVLQCFQSLTATPVSVTLTDSSGNTLLPFLVGSDGAGNIWWVAPGNGLEAGTIPNEAQCSNLPSTSIATTTIPVPQTAAPQFMTSALPSGGNPGIWLSMEFGTGDGFGYLQSVYLNSGAGPTIPIADAPFGLTSDRLGNLYVQSNQIETDGQTIYGIPPGSTTPTAYPNLLDMTTNPYVGGFTPGLAEFSDSTGTASELLTPGLALNVLNLRAKPPTWLTIPPPNAYYCGASAFDASGLPWVACAVYPTAGTTNLIVFSAIVTGTWSLAPNVYDVSTTPASQTMAVMETGVDSSPFTAVSSNPSVLTVSSPAPGFSHQIPITLNATGTATVTVTDVNGRSQSIAVSVVPGSWNPNPSIRRTRTSRRLNRNIPWVSLREKIHR